MVIESTTNAWYIYDLLEPLAEKVLVANPIKMKQMPGFGVITGMTVLAAIGDITRFESPRYGAKLGEAAGQEDHQGGTQGFALGDTCWNWSGMS